MPHLIKSRIAAKGVIDEPKDEAGVMQVHGTLFHKQLGEQKFGLQVEKDSGSAVESR